MATTTVEKYRHLFQTIIEKASDEEREELAREVERIEADFERFGHLLSCLEGEDRCRLLQVLGTEIGGAIVLANRDVSEAESTPKFNFAGSIICVAALTSRIERMCISVFREERGEDACRRNLIFARRRFVRYEPPTELANKGTVE